MMKLKRGTGFCLFFLILILASSLTQAIGVSPAGYNLEFQPEFSKIFTFTFRDGEPGIKYNVFVSGDLAEYVELSEESFYGSGEVNALLKLPKKIDKPGVHRIRIGLEPELTGPQNSTIVVLASVVGVIDVRVPYPGKYVELDFGASNANAGQPINLKLKIYSRGDQDIVTSSNIEIFDLRNRSIESISLGVNEVQAQSSIELSKDIDTRSYGPGRYRAEALVKYDENEAFTNAFFRLGELFVDLIGHTKEFDRNKINMMNIEVESNWNDPIEGLYAEIYIIGYESVIPRILTPSINLKGFEKTNLQGYFDTSPIEDSKFKAKIILNYNGKITEEIVDLRFKKEINYLLIGIITGGLILIGAVITLALWVKKLSRRMKKSYGKK